MKRSLILGAAVAAALSTAGCEVSRAGGRLVIGVGTEIGVLLPVIETSALDGEINSLLYLSLNSARWGAGAIEYTIDELSLAERWEFSPDSTVLIYDLRDDAVWSDGHPIDAEDVAFTFELVRRPTIASVYVDSWEQLDSVVALSERRVAFHFKRRYPGALFDTGLGIVPAHVFEGAASDNATLAGHPSLLQPGGQLVVSGPFQVAEWRKGDRLVLTANPRALAPPQTDTVVFRFLPDETTRLIELENGSLDLSVPAPMDRAAELAADPRFRVETINDRFYDYIAWNAAAFEPFGDPAVRRALSLAIDREKILGGLGIAGFARPAAGPYPAIFTRLVDPALRPDPHLPDSARALLARAGWVDTDGDGVLERDGRPFRFSLLTQAGNARRRAAAEILQSGFADVGIDVRIRLLEFNALLARVFETRDYEAVLLGWQVALEPDYLVGHFWPADHPFNITGYASAALDSLVPLAQSAATARAAAPYWREAARAISTDQPYAFLWFFDDAVLVNERVRDTRIDTYGLYQNLHEWRIER